MKFYEFGDLNKPVFILLPGTCCHWKAKNPDIRRHDMQHGELLICYPERQAEEVRKCCGL